MSEENLSAGNAGTEGQAQNESAGGQDNGGGNQTGAPAAKEPPAPRKEPAKKPAEAGKSGLDSLAGDGSDEERPEPTDWPADWREKYAGQDAKALKALQRYGSPKAALDALFNAQEKIKTTKRMPELPENATPEQLKEYRKATGIPDKPDDYKIELADGYVPGKEDEPYVKEFLNEMHGKNATNEQTNAALNAYYRIRETMESDRAEADEIAFASSYEELREEFGKDFKRNHGAVTNFLQQSFGDDYAAVANARGPDGAPLFSNPEIFRKFFSMATTVNPLITITPNAGSEGLKSVKQELDSIRKVMHTAAYQKDSAKQARYRELIKLEAQALQR
jgi:hypothetical protein